MLWNLNIYILKVSFCFSCAVDTDLFPHMSRVSQGVLQAAFGAFRTTSLAGGSVAMPFSCTLQVCLGSCTPVIFQNDSATFPYLYCNRSK